MDTSRVTVGTAMYMITDSLTYRSQENPRRSGAPVPLLVPCFLARTRPLLCPRRSMRRSTSEPAARTMTTRDRLYRRAATLGVHSRRYGHLTRSRPRDSAIASQAVGRQGGLTDLCEAMSAFRPIASALPPAPDVAGTQAK